MASEQDTFTYIDTHCHYCGKLSFGDFLQSALSNLSSAGHSARSRSHSRFALCLIEFGNGSDFIRLAQAEEAGFTVRRVDANTLEIDMGDDSLLIFTGRQLVTRERLEVIIIGYPGEIENGLPAEEYIKRYSDQALVVLPWGVGKWLAKRHQVVSALLEKYQGQFVLGDNGGRPGWWRSIPHFRRAEALQIPVLAGSDPLPVSSFVRRVASYGSRFPASFDSCSQWVEHVRSLRGSPQTYGSLATTLTFLKDQLGIRVNKNM